jgi:ribosomal protein S14
VKRKPETDGLAWALSLAAAASAEQLDGVHHESTYATARVPCLLCGTPEVAAADCGVCRACEERRALGAAFNRDRMPTGEQ